MRLRRLEFAILIATLAFAFFMGGFFTGRSSRTVNVISTSEAGSLSNGASAGVSGTQSSAAQPETGATPNNAGEVSGGFAQTTPENQGNANTEQPQTDFQSGDGKININTAAASELINLPGIGNVIAARIVDYRTSNGNFRIVEDIMKVSGIGERKFEAIAELITVGN
ncbi:MAG: helix-hairpin-helix domain-containing protein [Oscillospiraceae bacterium]|nr:helix-hairpin-helix domain-containing protein [Oscillospiraceae bacterium]